MVLPPTSRLRAVRGSPDERAFWRRAIAQNDLGTLTALKNAQNVGVHAAHVAGRNVIFKCWRLTSLAHRAYAALRSTRGSRQWRGTRRLQRLGIDTPACHALLRGWAGDSLVEVLVLERLPGRTLLEHLARPTLSVRDQHELARVLARQCAAMARAGWFNRDPKPSNLMVLETPQQPAAIATSSPRLAVLDAVAIRPLPPHRRGPVGVPLERLVLEAIGVGVTPRRTLMSRFVRAWVEAWVSPAADRAEARAARRRVWKVLVRRVAHAENPTPTDNPLPAVGS